MPVEIGRRELVAALGSAAAWPLAARAQQSVAHVPSIGLLWPGVTPPMSPRMECFRRGLREQGFVDGRNVLIELRYAQQGPQRLADYAAEFVRMNVDVIYSAGDLAPKIAQQATRTIPIIAITDDILGAGLISNLSRPGGNISKAGDCCAAGFQGRLCLSWVNNGCAVHLRGESASPQ